MSAWERRPPAEIQMGNGTLLATFDSFGEIEQLFAPHIDALQSRLGAFRTLVVFPAEDPDYPPGLVALVPEEFEATTRLRRGSQVLEVEYRHRHGNLRVRRTLGLHPTDPIMLDSWEVLEGKAGLLHQSVPWVGNATSAHCSLYHPTFNGLVHHRGRRWLGVIARDEVNWVRVGHLSDHDRHRLYDGERLFAPVGAHDLQGYPRGAVKHGWDQVVQGTATWGALASAVKPKIEFFIICAESERHLGSLLEQISKIQSDRYFQMIESWVERRHSPAAPLLDRIGNRRVRELAERSIDVLHALQDAGTGALMAAAEVDPHSKLSGGYGYSWPRDGAYLATALGAFNYRERVEHYFHFLEDTQDPSGIWWQRYLATGHAGPSWGRIQIDETASVIGAAYIHFRRTRDLFWLEKNWKTLERGLRFLEEFHGPEHPLGLPSHDLWEERMGVHAYSLGVVAWAFDRGASLARELSHEKAAQRYHEWGEALKTIISENFFPREGAVRRAFIGGAWDETPDASLLGLFYPFHIYDHASPEARRIVEMARAHLWMDPVGGVLRYPGDHYRGGNPWILTTLWLGIMELELGNLDGARRCFEWSVSKATSLDMLAEQVHRETGEPFWVIPLAWSHAMYLLFVREVLDRDLGSEIFRNLE